jgi:predicted metal-binding protein
MDNKIGIIICSNSSQELDCCSSVCLRDLSKRIGAFSRYSKEENLQLVGMVTCSGCPTLAYPEKILRKIDSLVQFGVKSIHFTNCMVALCPFLKKYSEVINKAYPEIELIEGTHEANITNEYFREKVNCAFRLKKNMSDIILRKI